MTQRREADEHRRGDLAGVRALQLVMDVLGPDPDVRVRSGQRVTDRGQADERRADDPGDAGDPRARRDRPGQLAGLGRGGVHLPVGGHDHVTHRLDHARAACPGPGPSGSSVASRSSRSSARCTAERWISSRSASSARLASGRLATRLGHEPDDVRLVGQPPVGVERRDRVELATGRAHGALEIGRFRR